MAARLLSAVMTLAALTPAVAYAEEPAPRCIRAISIRNIEVIDNRHILVDLGHDYRLVMELGYECSGLKFHETIFYRTTNGELCVNDFITSRAGTVCPITRFTPAPTTKDAP